MLLDSRLRRIVSESDDVCQSVLTRFFVELWAWQVRLRRIPIICSRRLKKIECAFADHRPDDPLLDGPAAAMSARTRALPRSKSRRFAPRRAARAMPWPTLELAGRGAPPPVGKGTDDSWPTAHAGLPWAAVAERLGGARQDRKRCESNTSERLARSDQKNWASKASLP